MSRLVADSLGNILGIAATQHGCRWSGMRTRAVAVHPLVARCTWCTGYPVSPSRCRVLAGQRTRENESRLIVRCSCTCATKHAYIGDTTCPTKPACIEKYSSFYAQTLFVLFDVHTYRQAWVGGTVDFVLPAPRQSACLLLDWGFAHQAPSPPIITCM
jgi:hypothetical protein